MGTYDRYNCLLKLQKKETIMAEVAALLIHMERKAVGSMNPSIR